MLKLRAVACTVVAVVLAVFSLVQAEEKHNQELALKGIQCLFCKMDVQQEAAVDYKGVQVFFGCPGCPAAFKKDPEKYATLAHAQIVATEQAKQIACPLSGRKHNNKFKLTVNQAEVAFCCPNCKQAVAKLDKEDQVTKVFNEAAFKKAFQIPKQQKAP